MDRESVQTTEGKVLGHGIGPGQRLPEGCLVFATCGVPDWVQPGFQGGHGRTQTTANLRSLGWAGGRVGL